MDALIEWQNRMEGHFADLAKRRSSNEFPIFALEHGLEKEELDEVCGLLRSSLKSASTATDHWLLWVIYAAELGYSYEGAEYWQSFERATPGWTSDSREFISSSFLKFRNQFRGVTPTGRWANQFRIISWPITHAILPKYLQRQFLRSLYDIRFRLAEVKYPSSTTLGSLIAINASYPSNRFQEFLEQESLVGRIAMALLYHDQSDEGELLLGSTLKRIVSDLESIRHGRTWLNETSQVVKPRLKGMTQESKAHKNAPQVKSKGESLEKRGPLVKPELSLRRSGDNEWKLIIEIPNFKSVSILDKNVHNFLQKHRAKINGAEGKKPPGWLLFGKPTAVLDKWPDPQSPLVKFDERNGFIENVLDNECRIPNKQPWLFRVNADGVAKHVKRNVVKPNNEYIVIFTEEFGPDVLNCARLKLGFSGAKGFWVSVPEKIDSNSKEVLGKFSLHVGETTQIWPAGMPGRGWDGQGLCDVLTTERACFGIRSDHLVDSYLVTLGKEMGTVISVPKVGAPVFVQLPHLEPGQYALRVVPRRGRSPRTLQNIEDEIGALQIRVREPEPWVPGSSSHAGLVVRQEPNEPSLEKFWQNEVSLSIFGPLGREIHPTVCLQDARGEEFYCDEVSGPVKLPLYNNDWEELFDKFLESKKNDLTYLQAETAILRIDAYELGYYTLKFDSHSQPLRWTFKIENDSLQVKLVDEADKNENIELCKKSSISSPYRFEDISLDKSQRGLEVTPPGSLFYVDDGEFRDIVAVSYGVSGKGLRALSGVPDLTEMSLGDQEVIDVCDAISLWSKAKLIGFLAKSRINSVLREMEGALVYTLGGKRWSVIEEKVNGGEIKVEDAKDRFLSLIATKTGFPYVLERDLNIYKDESYECQEERFSDVAIRFGISTNKDINRAALRVAHLERPNSGNGERSERELVREALWNTSLIRGARFIAFLKKYDISIGGTA